MREPCPSSPWGHGPTGCAGRPNPSRDAGALVRGLPADHGVCGRPMVESHPPRTIGAMRRTTEPSCTSRSDRSDGPLWGQGGEQENRLGGRDDPGGGGCT